ncbi:SDR family NAD(P)-dependent oxidoreductase [uncultured Arcticibacterium sp.]|uniref:SDR family NAD(P)-dependent oxidoreductase n=1 Tax=uncultured Arcticibacterium sp. TaxID=2173042 RepID=UPI0030F8DA5C
MKTILITGSTDGIGKLTAIQLAKKGHAVYMHGRNETKLLAAIKEVKQLTKNDNIDGFVADFSKLEVVSKMVDEVKSKLSTLDILINNAGILKSKNEATETGHDIRFVVNYFAPYVLTNSLLPILRKGNNSRIINLSSAAQSPVSMDALSGKVRLSAQAAYAQSKLALTMWSNKLAVQEKGIIVIPVNPGSLLNTNMVKEAYGQFWSSADKGADILTELAVSEKHTESNGKYFDNDKGTFSDAHNDAYNQEKINQMISETNKILKL